MLKIPENRWSKDFAFWHLSAGSTVFYDSHFLKSSSLRIKITIFLLFLQAGITVFIWNVLWSFIRVQCWNTAVCNLHRTAKYVNLHANPQVPHLTAAFCEVKFDFLIKKGVLNMKTQWIWKKKVLVKTRCFWTPACARQQPLNAHDLFIRNTLPLTVGWAAGWWRWWRVGGLVGWLAGWLG